MPRRSRISVAATAVALSLSLVAAACGGEAVDSSDGGSTSTSITALGGTSTAQQLDPHLYKNIADYQYLAMVYDGLFEFGPGGEPVGQLAESGEFSDDGAVFTVTLKEGATFQDGTPIDAEAVKGSLERGQTLEASTVAERLAAISGMEVISATELAISVTDTARNLPEILAGPEGMIVKSGAKDIALDPGDSASGPYEVTEFEPGGRAVFRLIDDYWNDDYAGATTVEVTPTGDAPTRVTALRAGDGDVGSVGGVSVDRIETEIDEGRLDLDLVFFEHPTHLLLQFTRSNAPFDDVRVRQAVAHAIDLSEAPTAILGSTAEPADRIVPQLEGDRPYEFDPAEARSLLAAAGLEDGFSFELGCFDGDLCSLAEAIQAQLAQVDIDMQITEMPAADLRGRMADGTLDAALEGSSPVPTAAARIQALLFNPGLRIAELGDGAEHAAELFDRVLTQSLTDDEVDEAYEALDEYVWAENAWYVPLVYYRNAVLGRSGIGGLDQLFGTGVLNPRVLVPAS